jgi:hypothetical protein
LDDKRSDNHMTPYNGKGRKVTARQDSAQTSEKTAAYVQLHRLLGGLARLEDRSSEGLVSSAGYSTSGHTKSAVDLRTLVSVLAPALAGGGLGYLAGDDETKVSDTILGALLGGAAGYGYDRSSRKGPAVDSQDKAPTKKKTKEQAAEQAAEQGPESKVPKDVRKAWENLGVGQPPEMLLESGIRSILPESWVPKGVISDTANDAIQLAGGPGRELLRETLVNGPKMHALSLLPKEWVDKALYNKYVDNALNMSGAEAETLAVPAATALFQSNPVLQLGENIVDPLLRYGSRSRDLSRIQELKDALEANPGYADTFDGQGMLNLTADRMGTPGKFYKNLTAADPSRALTTDDLRRLQYDRATAPDQSIATTVTGPKGLAWLQGAGSVAEKVGLGRKAITAGTSLLGKAAPVGRLGKGGLLPIIMAAENAATYADWFNRARVAQQYDPTASFMDSFRDVVYRQGRQNAYDAVGGRKTPTWEKMYNSAVLGLTDQAGYGAGIAALREDNTQAWRNARSSVNVAKGAEEKALKHFDDLRREKGYSFRDYNKVPAFYKRKHHDWKDHVRATPQQRQEWEAAIGAARTSGKDNDIGLLEYGHEGDPMENMGLFDRAVSAWYGL